MPKVGAHAIPGEDHGVVESEGEVAPQTVVGRGRGVGHRRAGSDGPYLPTTADDEGDPCHLRETMGEDEDGFCHQGRTTEDADDDPYDLGQTTEEGEDGLCRPD